MRFRFAAPLVLVAAWGVTAPAQVKLERKVTENATVVGKTEIKVHQILTLAGMDIETNSDSGSLATVAVGKRNADGTIPLNVTVDKIWVKISLPMGIEIDLNTDDKDLKVDLPQLSFLADVLKASKGANYTLVLDSKNQFARVEGIEKNLDRAKDLPEAALAGMKARYNSDRVKQEFEQVQNAVPDGFLREGEPWERTEVSDIGAGQTLTFKRKFEYKGTIKQGDKTLDKIDIKALDVTYKQDTGMPQPLKVTKSDIKVESSEGTLLFDRERGTIVERNDKTHIKGDMTMEAQGNELPAKLDLTFETKYSATPKAKQ